MPRYSTEKGEIAAKRGADKKYESEAGRLPKKPQDGIDAIYGGREHVSKKDWLHEEHAENNQFIEDAHDNGRGNYNADTKGWSRGGPAGGAHRPGFDNGKLDPNNTGDRKAKGPKCEATGQDIPASPFSKAHRRGAGEGF